MVLSLVWLIFIRFGVVNGFLPQLKKKTFTLKQICVEILIVSLFVYKLWVVWEFALVVEDKVELKPINRRMRSRRYRG
jgi:hypothetical protein